MYLKENNFVKDGVYKGYLISPLLFNFPILKSFIAYYKI